MVGRISTTVILFFIAVCAFWSDALGAGHLFNPFGILFLVLAALVWFAWRPIRDGFLSAKEESNIPIIRLGSAVIRGMRRPPRADRQSS
jgi:hypothetical protein